jgi:hypothetical protein
MCRKYWHCYGSVGEHLMCGPGLYYEVDDVACDFPENVDCGDRQERGAATIQSFNIR